ncbi:hypothetical protein Q1695_013451 [Nippostrongylus brasiliensis]|nr:hypothetical protein Q1695_013451 [Nippostrongylus brasiliensis]
MYKVKKCVIQNTASIVTRDDVDDDAEMTASAIGSIDSGDAVDLEAASGVSRLGHTFIPVSEDRGEAMVSIDPPH